MQCHLCCFHGEAARSEPATYLSDRIGVRRTLRAACATLRTQGLYFIPLCGAPGLRIAMSSDKQAIVIDNGTG